MTESSSLVLLRSLQGRIKSLYEVIDTNNEKIKELSSAVNTQAQKLIIKDKEILTLKKELDLTISEFVDTINIEEIPTPKRKRRIDGDINE